MSSQPRTNSRLRGSATASPNATHGSQTITLTPAGPSEPPSATLRLRAEPQESSHVRWASDVVDNEGMGKKSSKVCCIYHKPKEPGDSDSDSASSSSEDDSDSEPDLSRAQQAGGGRSGRHAHGRGGKGRGKGKGTDRKPSPNAYERQPRAQAKGV
nr:type 1 phosphatases regulator ypi1 [Quercus suber]